MKYNFDETYYLQHTIKELIDETLEKWNTESSKITIESFKRKRDCLLIIQMAKWGQKSHHFKCTISFKPDPLKKNFKKLKKLLHLIEDF